MSKSVAPRGTPQRARTDTRRKEQILAANLRDRASKGGPAGCQTISGRTANYNPRSPRTQLRPGTYPQDFGRVSSGFVAFRRPG